MRNEKAVERVGHFGPSALFRSQCLLKEHQHPERERSVDGRRLAHGPSHMRRTRRLWWENKPAQCLRYWRRIQSDSLGNFPLRAKDWCAGVVATRKESATVKRNHACGFEHALNGSGVIRESLCA